MHCWKQIEVREENKLMNAILFEILVGQRPLHQIYIEQANCWIYSKISDPDA